MLNGPLSEITMRARLIALILVFCLVFLAPSKTFAATPQPAKATVAVFRLDRPVTETPDESLALFGPQAMSLKELLEHMRKAADDSNVKAVVLFCEDSTLGAGQSEEVRQAIETIRDAKKDVYVHVDSCSMSDYVLMSAATRISVVPTADLWVNGRHGSTLHLRGLLDKIGVKPDFMTCGKYKSAAEIFMRTEPSPEADQMMNWLFDGMYENDVQQIAAGRKVSAEKVRQWIDDGPYSARTAKEAGLIDAIEQRQDFEGMLKQKYGDGITFNKQYGEKPQPQMDFSSPFAMFKFIGDLMGGGEKKKPSTRPSVGIVYVDGPIMLGQSEPSLFGGKTATSTDIRKALDEAAHDDAIKAVVLRVDSPGGSAVASEIILDATRRVKAKKPLVVSMGDVAGSGGYYVTCASDTIFADRSTITASIGVVSGKLVTTDMWKKIGITFKEYKRGKNAGMLSTAEPFSDEERQKMRAWMDEIYDVFKKHVTDARGDKLKKPIDEVAGGRVYTGQQALELGLVDKIGTLQDAVSFAADQAKLSKDYEVRIVPEPKNFLEKLMEESTGDKDPHRIALGEKLSLTQLAVPYLQNVDPQRVAAVTRALQMIDALQGEKVMLISPEVLLQN
jgi:protease-4